MPSASSIIFIHCDLLTGRIQPIAEMRKTHLIVLCFTVSVSLALVCLVSLERHARLPTTISVETTAPAEPSVTVASPAVLAAPTAPFIRTQLRLAAAPGDVLDKIRDLPGVESAEFDAKSSNLVVTHASEGPSAKALAEVAGQAGLVVRGEVLDLPLTLEDPHLETCGSCGLVIYERLQKKSGVHAVEVFLPVKNQLRLLVEPGSNATSEVTDILSNSSHTDYPAP